MTKEDYQLIADALKEAFVDLDVSAAEMHNRCCNYIADAMKEDNDRFDRVKFDDAIYSVKG